jgi:hypothetical protein
VPSLPFCHSRSTLQEQGAQIPAPGDLSKRSA